MRIASNYLALSSVVLSVGLSGCSVFSSPKYDCELNSADGVCSSMNTTYSAAKQSNPKNSNETVFTDYFDSSALPVAGPNRNARVQATGMALSNSLSGWPQPAQQGMPVFNHAKVYRAWVAPWTDASGLLHAGEYVYFSTPGNWNYGSLKSPGNASGMFAPLKPGQYGFKPVFEAERQTESQNQAQSQANDAATNEFRPTDSIRGVTQPYEKLEN